MGTTKQELTCPWHYDLEELIKTIDDKLDNLRLFNAKIVGGFVVLNISSILILKLIKIL